jgi:peptidyl-prolyl cis-trans isomerase A (cyclophilin A)
MAAKGDPHVLLTTSAGNIELELNSQKAPISVIAARVDLSMEIP